MQSRIAIQNPMLHRCRQVDAELVADIGLRRLHCRQSTAGHFLAGNAKLYGNDCVPPHAVARMGAEGTQSTELESFCGNIVREVHEVVALATRLREKDSELVEKIRHRKWNTCEAFQFHE